MALFPLSSELAVVDNVLQHVTAAIVPPWPLPLSPAAFLERRTRSGRGTYTQKCNSFNPYSPRLTCPPRMGPDR